MILIDSSAWIEFLRSNTGGVGDAVERHLDTGAAVICDAVRMELLAGARDDTHERKLRGLLSRAETVPIGPDDYERAAILYRTCRRNGETVRRMIDCLIAAVAIREDVPILHADADFEVLSRWTDLRVA